MPKTILKAGSLALWDSFSGMIRIKIESVNWYDASNTLHSVTFRITSRNNRVYKCGEIQTTNGLHIVPRNIRYMRGTYHQKYVTPPFEFETDK